MKVATANKLGDGAVVFLGVGRWVGVIDQALVAKNVAQARDLETQMRRSAAVQEIVDPYLIDVEASDGQINPIKFRERIRAQGPTVRADLGYQAGQRNNEVPYVPL